MNNNEIRVKVNGGYLVAGENADPDHDGIYIVFETDDEVKLDKLLDIYRMIDLSVKG